MFYPIGEFCIVIGFFLLFNIYINLLSGCMPGYKNNMILLTVALILMVMGLYLVCDGKIPPTSVTFDV